MADNTGIGKRDQSRMALTKGLARGRSLASCHCEPSASLLPDAPILALKEKRSPEMKEETFLTKLETNISIC